MPVRRIKIDRLPFPKHTMNKKILIQIEHCGDSHIKYIVGNYNLSVAWGKGHYCDRYGDSYGDKITPSATAEVFLMSNKTDEDGIKIRSYSVDVWGWVEIDRVLKMVQCLQEIQSIDSKTDEEWASIFSCGRKDYKKELEFVYEKLDEIVHEGKE